MDTPVIEPIRGGTDGLKISFMGIPTPNLLLGAKICMVDMSLFPADNAVCRRCYSLNCQ